MCWSYYISELLLCAANTSVAETAQAEMTGVRNMYSYNRFAQDATDIC